MPTLDLALWKIPMLMEILVLSLKSSTLVLLAWLTPQGSEMNIYVLFTHTYS